MRIEIFDSMIETVRADFSVTLGLSGGTEIRIETDFEIAVPGHSPVIIDPEGWAADSPTARALQGRTIIRAEAEDASGTLAIALDNRTEIRIPAHADHEAWSVSSLDGVAVVALPGGGIAHWGANGQNAEES
ncbi:MAG: hypothetical protein JF592_02865 [Microbacterium sp.]|uniref:DUF6188 family protein n=1 Tax=Microbacterium sp. TaxID=51671 RepID=UPI001DD2ADCC|nr:DUF6188 family protein [Microbacterium sp.]MBW8761511.1 hypothetical protein [Microbacterium sp.]